MERNFLRHKNHFSNFVQLVMMFKLWIAKIFMGHWQAMLIKNESQYEIASIVTRRQRTQYGDARLLMLRKEKMYGRSISNSELETIL